MQVSTCWDEALPLPETLSVLRDLALRHTPFGGKVGSSIEKLIRANDWAAVCAFDLDLSGDWNVSQLLHCRQALGFFTKFEQLEIGVDKEATAFVKFEESETLCKSTNDLFRAWLQGSSVNLRSCDVRVLYAARRKIATVLGRCPKVSELDLRFGPGATTSTKKSEAYPQRKFADGLCCSDELLHSGLLPTLLRELPHWTAALSDDWYIDEEDFITQRVDVHVVPGHLQFVPKNAKTYRSIVVEPVLNTLLQGGIGRWLTRRLKQAGVDISDQSRNARLARKGSIDGSLATLDLSSASDTISRQLVKFLLPPAWYTLLAAARTGTVLYKENRLLLQKFSSMGNGFTFPLETLIFWALTVSACSQGTTSDEIGVYGDDIICPSGSYEGVARALHVAGFLLNKEKSYVSGPFRESCGKDYYNGILVRPYYQKHLVSGLSLFVLHNYYVRDLDADSAAAVLEYIPETLRVFGPDGYGDGHLISDDWNRYRSPRAVAKGYSGSSFETLTLGKRRKTSLYPGDWVSPLYSVYTRGRQPLVAPFPGLARELIDSQAVEFTKSGRPIWTAPGYEGYKKLRIYTLAP